MRTLLTYRKPIMVIFAIVVALVLFGVSSVHAQDYITGPWLWMMAPTTDGVNGSRTVHDDSLADASGGAVTEECVATNGAKVGDSVGNYAWALSTIRNTGIVNTGCCQGSEIDNVTDVFLRLGWVDGNVDYHSSYALITLESAAPQNNVLMRIGSDDAVKVWLNGTVVHTNATDRASRGFQDEFRVNLEQGDNLLLVKVSEGWGNWSMFVGISANVNAVYKPGTVSCSAQSAVTPAVATSDTVEFRVKGGVFEDFTDSKGRVWRGAQQSNQTWGGWIEKQPRTATHRTLTTNAHAQAEAAGYDPELFYAVSWAQHPDTVKYQLKTGNGVFDVTYLVSEHWSPNNRGFDIIIEGEVVEPLYVTPGRHEIDIRTYKGIEVSDGTLDLQFSGAPETQVTDLNPMFSALEVVPSVSDPTTTTQTIAPLLSFSPSPGQSPAVGEQLTLDLNIADGENIVGYQVTLQFDTTALRYVSSANADYLPVGTFAVPAIISGNTLTIAAAALAGESNGNGTLATLTFEVVAAKASVLMLADVFLTNSEGQTFQPQVEDGQITEPLSLGGDVNSDGIVDIRDLVLVASNFGQTGEHPADVNKDGVVDIVDLVLIAGAFANPAAAPSAWYHNLDTVFTRAEVEVWLTQARALDLTDTTSLYGIRYLEHLLMVLTPKETVLLANYPNPFNPETWMPYQLAKSADVSISVYGVDGRLVRMLSLGHRMAGSYHNKSRAAYWDGKNESGESVASGVYFYTLTAGDFTATRKMLIRK